MKKILFVSLFSFTSSVFADTSLGMGAGIPYGIVGFNLNHSLTQRVDLSVGLGTTIFAGSAYSVGANYYLTDEKSGMRLTALYGTNTIVDVSSCNDCYFPLLGDYETYEGITLGVGWGHRAGDSGWDIDLLFIATSGAEDKIDQLRSQGYDHVGMGSKVKLSFGYHWSF